MLMLCKKGILVFLSYESTFKYKVMKAQKIQQITYTVTVTIYSTKYSLVFGNVH